ncbi:Ig-like domain-containing protein, partial [Salmonella enterica]
ALVPAGAAQPVSPVKTALVFLAGPPDATNTTVSTDRSAANADNKETITVTLTPRDSHNNVVPLWTFRKDLTIAPSVNATVPGAVTVTPPAQDATGNVTATLTYVDTSGQLLSKAARTGTTSVSIGSAVKKTFDTRFYPQVHVCLTNLASEFVVPGQTEVKLCDSSGHSIADASGYSVTRPHLSQTACTDQGGGVCPPNKAGVKADFTNLSGDDVIMLLTTQDKFRIEDTYAGVSTESDMPAANMAIFGELTKHIGATDMSDPYTDLFHHRDAVKFCTGNFGKRASYNDDVMAKRAVDVILQGQGRVTGGGVTGLAVKGLYSGPINQVIKTGGDTNPEIFVDGIGRGEASRNQDYEQYGLSPDGTKFPGALVFVNGSRAAATAWTMRGDDIDQATVSFGAYLHSKTNWNLSDAYFVNNWPGTPYTAHKGNGDTNYPYVTQVNYITGYICAVSLH